MSGHLSIRTLGGLSISRDGEPLSGFDSRKVAALLVYLAATGHDHPREVLAEMLWEGRPQAQSLANLRVVFTSLRQTAGDFVHITRESAGMGAEADWELDTATFEDQLAAGRLSEPLDLYQGDFLAGFYVDSPAFEDWVALERERLRFRAMDALDGLIAACLERDSFADGIAHATRLLQMDPLREETHRAMMTLLARSGQRAAALAQFETCRTLLDEELGLTPSAPTAALAEQIRAGKFVETPPPASATASPPVQKSVLPRQATSFIGRENEIAAILAQLRDPACRLLTLLGPGGIGKTRLALAAAERVTNDFRDGVFAIELAPIHEAEMVVSAIAAAVGFQFYQSPDGPDVQLIRYLHDKTLLLVLDNFEHLLDGVSLVDRLLSEAPGVTILATSREALKLSWEWVFPVHGLTVAAPDCPADCDALRLFVARARQRLPGLALDAQRPAVTRLCQLVEGMPLAIELAAAWVGTLAVETIARELESSLDLLETEARDVPDRHRSIRAAFDPTWQRLSATEQEVFARLSVFRGGFTRKAAREVAGASLRTLMALVEKSLVGFDAEDERYSLHELLRQYGATKLAAAGQDAPTRDHHSLYYADFLHAQTPDLKGYRSVQTLQEVDTEWENIIAGWGWAVRQHDVDTIARALEGLREYSSKRGLWREAERLYERAIDAIEAIGSLSEHEELILAELLASEWWWNHDDDKRSRLQEKGHALVRRLGPRPEIPFALWILWGEGINEGYNIETFQELLTIYRKQNNRWGIGASLLETAHIYKYTGDYLEAERYYRESLSIFREIGNLWWMVWPLVYLSWILTVRGDPVEANLLMEEALELAESLHGPYRGVLYHAALAAIYKGNFDEAESLTVQASAAAKEAGDQRTMRRCEFTEARIHTCRGDGATACQLIENIRHSQAPPLTDNDVIWFSIEEGHAQLALGNLDRSRSCLQQALHSITQQDILDGEFLIDILVGVGSLLVRTGDLEHAAVLLGFTRDRFSIGKRVQEEARLLNELAQTLSPAIFTAACDRGRALTLDNAAALAQTALADLGPDEG